MKKNYEEVFVSIAKFTLAQIQNQLFFNHSTACESSLALRASTSS